MIAKSLETGGVKTNALEVAALQASAPVVLALSECDDELRSDVLELFKDLASGELDDGQVVATTALIAEILFPNADHNARLGLDFMEAEVIAPSLAPESKEILAQMDNEESHFAQTLASLMKERGLTQTQLAEKVGLGQPAISMMLNRAGRPQRKTVLRFADAFGVAPEILWPPFKASE